MPSAIPQAPCGSGLVEGFEEILPWVSHENTNRFGPGLQLCEGLSGAEGFSSLLTKSHDWQIGAGCWLGS
jgi:hypothetical protein